MSFHSACPDVVHVTGYLALGLMMTILFRVVQNTLPKNPAAQEAIIGAALAVLAFADVSLFFRLAPG